MCTEKSPNEIVVCDVAIPDVRAALGGLAQVTFVHRPYEGTLVVNSDPAASDAFGAMVRHAIARHNGQAGA